MESAEVYAGADRGRKLSAPCHEVNCLDFLLFPPDSGRFATFADLFRKGFVRGRKSGLRRRSLEGSTAAAGGKYAWCVESVVTSAAPAVNECMFKEDEVCGFATTPFPACEERVLRKKAEWRYIKDGAAGRMRASVCTSGRGRSNAALSQDVRVRALPILEAGGAKLQCDAG